jgi:hypothetical protein
MDDNNAITWDMVEILINSKVGFRSLLDKSVIQPDYVVFDTSLDIQTTLDFVRKFVPPEKIVYHTYLDQVILREQKKIFKPLYSHLGDGIFILDPSTPKIIMPFLERPFGSTQSRILELVESTKRVSYEITQEADIIEIKPNFWTKKGLRSFFKNFVNNSLVSHLTTIETEVQSILDLGIMENALDLVTVNGLAYNLRFRFLGNSKTGLIELLPEYDKGGTSGCYGIRGSSEYFANNANRNLDRVKLFMHNEMYNPFVEELGLSLNNREAMYQQGFDACEGVFIEFLYKMEELNVDVPEKLYFELDLSVLKDNDYQNFRFALMEGRGVINDED